MLFIEGLNVGRESLTVAQSEGGEGAIGHFLGNQLDQRRFVHCFGVFVNRFQNTLSQVLADLSFVLLSPAPLFPTFVSMTNLGIHQICPQICPQKDREPICFLMTAYE